VTLGIGPRDDAEGMSLIGDIRPAHLGGRGRWRWRSGDLSGGPSATIRPPRRQLGPISQNPVRRIEHVEVVLDDDDAVPAVDELRSTPRRRFTSWRCRPVVGSSSSSKAPADGRKVVPGSGFGVPS